MGNPEKKDKSWHHIFLPHFEILNYLPFSLPRSSISLLSYTSHEESLNLKLFAKQTTFIYFQLIRDLNSNLDRSKTPEMTTLNAIENIILGEDRKEAKIWPIDLKVTSLSKVLDLRDHFHFFETLPLPPFPHDS